MPNCIRCPTKCNSCGSRARYVYICIGEELLGEGEPCHLKILALIKLSYFHNMHVLIMHPTLEEKFIYYFSVTSMITVATHIMDKLPKL